MRTLDSGSSATRGQSEVLGVALLVGIAVIGAVAVATVGFAALDGDREEAGFEQAEKSLSQFDSRASDVALGQSPGTRIDFGLPSDEGTLSTRPEEGWMRVNFTDLTGQANPNTLIVTNTTLGAVVYQKGDRTVGYQAGGVFRSEGNRSVLVSRPELHYRNGTLTIPVIRTEGDRRGFQKAQVTPGTTTRKFPDPVRDTNLTNKVNNTIVTITVKSRYYEAWGTFFREYTNGLVEVNRTNRTASVQFISLPDPDGIAGGVIATAESGDLALVGTGAYVDSYNSSNGPYSSGSSDGEVRAVGDIRISADATIDSNVAAGKDVRVEESASTITGNANYTDDLINDGTIEGETNEINGVATVLPIDPLVANRIQQIRANNNNSQANSVSGVDLSDRKLTVSRGDQVTLESGRYYMEQVEIDGGELVLDTSSGNITLAVEDWIKVVKSGGSSGVIDVEGDGIVKIYLGSRTKTRVSFTGAGNAPTRDLNFFVGKQSEVTVDGDESPRFRVFAPQITTAAIAGSSSAAANFTGLIYAPDGLDLSGSIYAKQANVYGGLAAGKIILGQYGRVHYDKNLADLELPTGATLARLEYLHVAVHRMNVTSAT